MILFLILLIFISKVSFAFLPFVPIQLGPVIFQHGMHPYINIVFSLFVGSLLILKWLWKPNHFFNQSRFYRFCLVLVCLYLLLITFLQSLFVNSDESMVLQMGVAFLACFTIVLFGRIIPTSLSPEKLVRILKWITMSLCWVSLFALVIFPGTSFKGGRFIGVFKHIPHMVSCGTIACFCLMYDFLLFEKTRMHKLISWVQFALAFLLLMLTGTRSALASVLFGLILLIIISPSRTVANRFLKMSFVIASLFATLFFGEDVTRYAMDIARGEKSIGGRAAQDGVASRLEEAERGYQIFLKDQWLGQGLLSKFSAGNEADVNNYNANKDPHNVFLSAGVVGGWGLIVLTTVLLIALLVASLKSLRSKNRALRILAIYSLSQIPIIIIYHLHVSIGGIADRIYWIVFGYMALKEYDVKTDEIRET